MEIFKTNRTRHSPSPDLFTAMFTPPITPTSWTAEDDLTEADVLWTATDSSPSDGGFLQPDSPGVLAALNEEDIGRRIVFQKNHRPREEERKYLCSHSQSLPCRRVQHSAPVKIPSFSKTVMRKCDEENDLTLPPHEIVAVKVKTTSSVLEGAGRTLKGRDLAQVRNAVWLQTGFIDRDGDKARMI